MSHDKALVLGASGFLGSHVVRALRAEGRSVRILVRPTSNTSITDHLDLERHVGDVFDPDTLRRTMEGCGSVFYCIVDARSWLRDEAPLYETNVEGCRAVMDAALDMKVERFVFTSSIVTIGLNPSGVASERDEFNWEDRAPGYVRTRVAAERQVLDYCTRGLPAVVCNVATTFGPHDRQPTPHGELVKRTVERTMPLYWRSKMSVVGIEDAADAMLLAERHGTVGERYIVADRVMEMREITSKTAAYAGVTPPRVVVPKWLLKAGVWLVEKLTHAVDKETVFTMSSLVLMDTMGDFDNSKAKRTLHWRPRSMDESLRRAVDWFQGREVP